MFMQNSMILCKLNIHLDGEENEENLPLYADQETIINLTAFSSDCCVEAKVNSDLKISAMQTWGNV